jgi:hypothetical protein
VHSLNTGLPYSVNASYVPENVQTPETKRANAFSSAFLEALEAITQRARLGSIWPLFEIMADKTRKPMEIVNTFLEPVIADAIRKKNDVHDEKEAKFLEDGTLLDHLVQVTSDPKILKDET